MYVVRLHSPDKAIDIVIIQNDRGSQLSTGNRICSVGLAAADKGLPMERYVITHFEVAAQVGYLNSQGKRCRRVKWIIQRGTVQPVSIGDALITGQRQSLGDGVGFYMLDNGLLFVEGVQPCAHGVIHGQGRVVTGIQNLLPRDLKCDDRAIAGVDDVLNG
ncbi:hypothetical protein D3C71_1758360 [compost metagenome]